MASVTSYVDCPKQPPLWWVRSRCGKDRDCVPDDRQPGTTMEEIVCAAVIWNSLDPSRYVEVWNPSNTRKVLHIKGSISSSKIGGRCAMVLPKEPKVGAFSEGEAFTIDVPGIQDIIKVKAWESPQLRYERYKRYETSRSAIPEPLKWLPPLLTQLDNAQDLLFTVAAIAIPWIRHTVPRILPGLGWVLTVNDILNLFT